MELNEQGDKSTKSMQLCASCMVHNAEKSSEKDTHK